MEKQNMQQLQIINVVKESIFKKYFNSAVVGCMMGNVLLKSFRESQNKRELIAHCVNKNLSGMLKRHVT
mgnify:CR=1 FL=1